MASMQQATIEVNEALAAEVARLRAEIERWRDSNNRLRDEMEHQAQRANNAEWALREIAEDPANAVSYFEDKWRTIARKALGLSAANIRHEPTPAE